MITHLCSLMVTATVVSSIFFETVTAQNTNPWPATGAVGIGVQMPLSSSLLEVRSTSKGVLIPRMTTAQRNAVVSPAVGLLIYQTDGVSGFYYYNSGWKAVTPPTSGFAGRTLSNLIAPTAVNVDLLPSTTALINLGSVTKNWKSLYLAGEVFVGNERFITRKGTTNIFFGSVAGNTATTGSFNTGLGSGSLNKITNGHRNTASGYYALFSNTSGYRNVATGVDALYNNTTGTYNTAVGAHAMLRHKSGIENTALGVYTLYSDSSGLWNTAIGSYAMYKNDGHFHSEGSIGMLNTAIGYRALYGNVHGNNNTAIGSRADMSSGNLTNSTAVGAEALALTSNQIMLGNTSVTTVRASGNFVIMSDGRFKSKITEEVPGLVFINKLRAVTYAYDIKGLNEHIKPGHSIKDGSDSLPREINVWKEEAIKNKEKKLYSGFIAQEVEEAARKLNYEFSGVYTPINDKDVYGLSYSDFVVPLVKAVQELDVKAKEMDELKKRVEKLEALLKVNIHAISLTSAYLEQSRPNPVRGVAAISYHVPNTAASAALTITSMNGQLIKTIAINDKGAGQITFNTSQLAAGTYNYNLFVDGKKVATKRMVVAR